MDKQLEERRIVRRDEVSRLTGLARATIYKKVKERSFPAPVRLGARSVGWRLTDLDTWLQAPERQWDPPRSNRDGPQAAIQVRPPVSGVWWTPGPAPGRGTSLLWLPLGGWTLCPLHAGGARRRS